ncbi:MAG: 3-isopropylmalate dehydratase [Chloroflexi bacterium]|nr:3-isopropylmalate dehydratase [Chloroflexota bacterium]MBI2975854.1 3-isopropylmalate dehydratase [Chloroflexota bacterium]
MMVGKVWKYGDGVNTDVIFPGKYTYTLKEPSEIAAHALEDLDPNFAREARAGDVIVAGRNWGNGSSREQAVTALKYRGIAAVVAKSFARIYFRNGINQGLLLVTCPEAVDAAQAGDMIEIDLPASLIRLGGREFPFPPLSPTALGIIEAGGLVQHIRRKLGLASTEAVIVSSGE